MKRLVWVIAILLVVLLAAGLGFTWWAHQVYTVGVDVNLKAIFVYGSAVVLLGCLALAVIWLRGGRVR